MERKNRGNMDGVIKGKEVPVELVKEVIMLARFEIENDIATWCKENKKSFSNCKIVKNEESLTWLYCENENKLNKYMKKYNLVYVNLYENISEISIEDIK